MNVLKRFLLSFMLMLTCTLVYAQTEITGTVFDDTGETVIGATVVEKGTNNGTVTDWDGTFTIKVNPGATRLHLRGLPARRDACRQWHDGDDEGRRPCPERDCGDWLHHAAQGRPDGRRERRER